MRRRQLFGGMAIVLALAAAIWYETAPSRSAPSAPLQVVVHGQVAGSGSWSRYLITVEDLADGTFNGDVLLTEPSPPATSTSVALALPFATARLPVPPVTAGQSAYQVHLTVPSRTSRTFTLLAPASFTTVEAVMQGLVLDAETVERTTAVPVAVLSATNGAASAIADLRLGSLTTHVDAYGSAQDFPTNPLLLAGYATIVIDDFDSATLSPPQLQALRDFVGLGGSLVLVGGAHWRRTLAPLPPALLPVRPRATTELGLEPVATLAGVGLPAVAVPGLVGSLAPGARPTLLEADGTPVMADLDYGAGRVIELAFDPEDGAIGAYRQLAWGQALARSLEPPPAGTTPLAITIPGPSPRLALLLAPAGGPTPPPGLVAAVLLLYLALIGPANYLLLYRRLRRPLLAWITVPVVSLVFVGLFSLVSIVLQAAVQDAALQIVKVGPDQTAVVLEYDRMSFLRRGDHQVLATTPGLAAPLTLEAYQATVSVCPTCVAELGGLPQGSEHVVPALRPTIDERGVVYGSQRVVAMAGTERAALDLQASLWVTNNRVVGTLRNPGQEPVGLPTLFTSDGQSLHEAQLGRLLPPGSRVAVDAALGAAGTGPQGKAGLAAVDRLLESVAASELSARAGTLLLGVIPPRPSLVSIDGASPPHPVLTVLEQPVTIAASTAPTDFERRWLASSSPSGSGLLDTYDLWVPATPVTLTVAPGTLTRVKVYDWARGVFVPLAGGPLSPTEVHDGLVRVQGHEAQLSWGAGLQVQAASG
jgi:hypothetical protein